MDVPRCGYYGRGRKNQGPRKCKHLRGEEPQRREWSLSREKDKNSLEDGIVGACGDENPGGDVKDLIVNTFSEENAKAYMDDSGIKMIADLTARRIKNLETLAKSDDRVQTIDNVDEVEENIAADYGSKLS